MGLRAMAELPFGKFNRPRETLAIPWSAWKQQRPLEHVILARDDGKDVMPLVSASVSQPRIKFLGAGE